MQGNFKCIKKGFQRISKRRNGLHIKNTENSYRYTKKCRQIENLKELSKKNPEIFFIRKLMKRSNSV